MRDVAARMDTRVQLTTDGHVLPRRGGPGVRGRYRLRDAHEAVWGRSHRGSAPLLAREVHRGRGPRHHREPGPRARLDQLHRATEPDAQDELTAVHPTDQCVLEEDREPRSGRGPALSPRKSRMPSLSGNARRQRAQPLPAGVRPRGPRHRGHAKGSSARTSSPPSLTAEQNSEGATRTWPNARASVTPGGNVEARRRQGPTTLSRTPTPRHASGRSPEASSMSSKSFGCHPKESGP